MYGHTYVLFILKCTLLLFYNFYYIKAIAK